MRKPSKLGVTSVGFVGLLVVSAACSSSDGAKGLPADQLVTALRGTIKGLDGQPVSGVTVKAGAATATSNAQGKFELKAPAGAAVAQFGKEGFVDTARGVTLVDGRPTQLDVTLLKLAPAIPLDATTGGTASAQRGATMVAPAGAFVDGKGLPVAGQVNVHLTPLDPSGAERATAPGFQAQQGGAQVMLESFGMMDVTVMQGTQKLQVAGGKELEVRIPAPAGAASPPATMPLWSFDEAKGVWVDEGTATYDAASKTYVGKAKHMSFWNADKVLTASCICGLVKEKGGANLPGARVEAEGKDYFGSSSTNTGLDGRFCVAVRKDSELSVAAYHRSGGGQARNVRSGGADTNVPPTMGDPRCVDVGVWEVERDVWVDSSGNRTTCGAVGNPFASNCAAELGSVFSTCYNPQGACTSKFEGGSATVRYANGAYFKSTGTGGEYYSSSGQLCASTTYEGTGGTGETVTIRYNLPNGKVFTITMANGGQGDMVIKCPDGSETRVTPEQRQALEACSGNGGGTSNQCTTEGLPDGGPGTCTSDAQCSGNVCCTIPNTTTRYCMPRATCDSIADGG